MLPFSRLLRRPATVFFAAAVLGGAAIIALLVAWPVALAIMAALGLPGLGRQVVAARQAQRRLVARLQWSEQRVVALADSSASGKLIFDGQARLTFANRRWAELTGMPVPFGSGGEWIEAAAPSVRPLLQEAWTNLLVRGHRFEGRIPYCRADPGEGFADLTICVEREAGGPIRHVTVSLTDQTDRFRAEARTAEREERYRLLAEHSSDVVLRLSPVGEILFASHAAMTLLGRSPDALAGTALLALAHPEDRAPLLARFTAAPSPAEPLPFRVLVGDDDYRWVELTLNRLADDLHWVASLRDIAARHRAEERRGEAERQLRESNRLLSLAEGLASVGHWHAATARGQVLFSRQAQALLALAEPHCSFAAGVALVAPEDRRRLLRAALGSRGGGSGECQLRLVRGDRTVLVRMQADRDSAGRLVATFGVVTDITDRLAADEHLHAACEEARAAARAKATFLATMSHEIRTPMTGVMGMIDLLRDDPRGRDRATYLATLQQSAGHLMTVLNDILDFSRLDSGQLEVTVRPFDLRETAAATVELFRQNAAAKGLDLELDWKAGAAGRVVGDPARLQQVLSNLVSNAIKFTDHGMVRLSVRATRAGSGKRRWRLVVSDSGMGIAPADRARLFEPFVQADSGADRRFGGTGLGLAISRRIVEAMGGELRLRASSGKGSTFAVELELADAAAAEPPAVARDLLAPDAPTTLAPLDILLAEDNQVNQLLVTALLRRLGHRVTTVGDGQDAVAMAARRHFDLILMDMQMPHLDGRSAAAAIRAGQGPCAAATIIALTADVTPDRRALYAAPPLDGFFAKPIDTDALADLLARLASQRFEDGDGAPAAAAATAAAAAFDQAALAEIAAALGPARTDELITLFAGELVGRPAAIRAALGRNELPAAAAEAHSLKGAALSIGGRGVGEAAAALEEALGAGGSSLIHQRMRALDRVVAATLALLPTLTVRQLPDVPATPASEPAIAGR